jgi:phage shock protein A
LRKEKDDEVAALKKELGELKQEVALLKGRVSQTAQTDAMQRELDGLKQIVQQLAARNPAKTATAKISEQTPGPSASNVADVR